VLPVAWQGYVPRWEQRSLATAPQQAALVRPSLGDANEPASAAPGEELAAAPTKATATPKELVEMPTVVLKKAASAAPATPVATPVVAKKEVSVPAAPVVAAAKPAASKPVLSVKDSKAVVVAAKPATTVVAKVPAAPAAIATAAAPAATTIKARTGRFYIMVAAYSSLARAEEGRRELLKTGRPAPQTKIILPFPGTHFYRLTAADFANRGEALVAADRLRQNPHFDKETYKGISVYGY
jgi:hypothetical protein